jgi:hypothetical protein
MTRECHVRFCERLGVKIPGATLPPGKSSSAAYEGLSGLASSQPRRRLVQMPDNLFRIQPILALSEDPSTVG